MDTNVEVKAKREVREVDVGSLQVVEGTPPVTSHTGGARRGRKSKWAQAFMNLKAGFFLPVPNSYPGDKAKLETLRAGILAAANKHKKEHPEFPGISTQTDVSADKVYITLKGNEIPS